MNKIVLASVGTMAAIVAPVSEAHSLVGTYRAVIDSDLDGVDLEAWMRNSVKESAPAAARAYMASVVSNFQHCYLSVTRSKEEQAVLIESLRTELKKRGRVLVIDGKPVVFGIFGTNKEKEAILHNGYVLSPDYLTIYDTEALGENFTRASRWYSNQMIREMIAAGYDGLIFGGISLPWKIPTIPTYGEDVAQTMIRVDVAMQADGKPTHWTSWLLFSDYLPILALVEREAGTL